MWNELYTFFSESPVGLSFVFSIAVVVIVCCVKLVNYMGETVLPNRAQKEIKREQCAGIIAGKVREFSDKHKCKMFRNVSLGENTTADVLLVGPFGVMAFVGSNVGAQLYPVDEVSESMIGYFSGKKLKFDNVMAERLRAEKALNDLVRNSNVKRCRCDALAVFTNGKAEIIAPDSMKFITAKELPTFIRKNKFFEDRGVNVEEIASLFEGKEAKA